MEHDNLFIQILEILSIKHTEDFTIRYYERHPHKNNLFGLSEMLRYYNIENVAAEIQKTQENLSSLDVPFVAYVDHEFVLVRHVSTEAIIYSWRGKNITLSIPVFLERWSGILTTADSNRMFRFITSIINRVCPYHQQRNGDRNLGVMGC